MSPASALAALYAVSGLVGCALYYPQLRALAKSAEARRAMSLATWGGWSLMGAITLAYVAVVVKDRQIVLINSLNLACQTTVFLVAVWQRMADWRARKPHFPASKTRLI
ncbi:MAG: hypothetical protein ACM33T_14465 [Solirubrobacterales bacterium]